jgi:threonine/homoserine/homoserine lactone efflux protein
MLGIENFYLFLIAGLALNFTPGPDMLYVAARSVSQGRGAGLVSSLAISTGGLVHTLAAALGLSAVVSYSATAFMMVKMAGALFLIYLGVRAWLDAKKPVASNGITIEPLGKVFAQGVMVNVLNPKVALFFVAFLPQFASPESGLFTVQIIVLGLVFNTTGTMVNSLVALIASAAGQCLRRPSTQGMGRRFSGVIYTAMGVGLALAGRD